jgi:mono/diheme cytochrome c family protein
MSRKPLGKAVALFLCAFIVVTLSSAGAWVSLEKHPYSEKKKGDPKRGMMIYAQLCVACHGEKSTGDGVAAPAIEPKPANHTDQGRMGKLSDEHLYSATVGGGLEVNRSANMPAWGLYLDEAEAYDLIAFLRSLAPYRGK